MRGNDHLQTVILKALSGSPPLARERHRNTMIRIKSLRITPACAGTTLSAKLFMLFRRDHPRLRGNDATQSQYQDDDSGSPPLARERHRVVAVPSEPDRITPACAGTTELRGCVERSERDHPRLRGNDRTPLKRENLVKGSPPLARERLGLVCKTREEARITPACAGTTGSNVLTIVV